MPAMNSLTLNQKLHRERDRVLHFCANHQKIRIFGGGDIAILFFRYLQDEGIEVTDFIIPDDDYRSDTFLGRPAYAFTSATFSRGDGVILAIESWLQGYVVYHLAARLVFPPQIYQQSIYGQFTDLAGDKSNLLPGYIGNDAPEGYFARYTELNECGKINGTDKTDRTHNYLNKYEFFLSRFKNDTFTLLELGVFKGASIRMWRDYFPNAHIVGVDYDHSCADMGSERIEVVIADLSQNETLEGLKKYNPTVILDDASHIWSHQIKSLCTLFEVLPHGGVFIMEDLETSFSMYRYQNYDDAPISCFQFLCGIAEVVTSGEYLDTETRDRAFSLFKAEIEEIAIHTELICFLKGSCVLIKK